jgi:hypothetical protein
MARELGADLADAIAEADHVVEPLPGEFVEMLCAAALEVDPSLAHHSYGVGMKRLGVASRATGVDFACAEMFGHCLGHL